MVKTEKTSDNGGITIISRNGLEFHLGISHLNVGTVMQDDGIIIPYLNEFAFIIRHSGRVLVLVIAQYSHEIAISLATHCDGDVLTTRVTVFGIKLDVRLTRLGISADAINAYG